MTVHAIKVSVSLCSRTEFTPRHLFDCYIHRLARASLESYQQPLYLYGKRAIWDSMGWHQAQMDGRMEVSDDLPATVLRNRMRAVACAAHVQAAQWLRGQGRVEFVHLNVWLDNECIVSSMWQPENAPAELDAATELCMTRLRAVMVDYNAQLEEHDRQVDDESTAAERMDVARHTHGRILSSGSVCVPGPGSREPGAE